MFCHVIPLCAAFAVVSWSINRGNPSNFLPRWNPTGGPPVTPIVLAKVSVITCIIFFKKISEISKFIKKDMNELRHRGGGSKGVEGWAGEDVTVTVMLRHAGKVLTVKIDRK